MPATADSLRRVLAAGEVAIGFPEGPEAVAKPLARRYRLAPFGAAALLRVAAETGAPIVPVAVIGAEEAQPVLWRSERLGRLLGLPAVPVTPPLVPLPTKWTIHVGEPLDAARATPIGARRARVQRCGCASASRGWSATASPASRPVRLSARRDALRRRDRPGHDRARTALVLRPARARARARLLASSRSTIPQPGWVEHDAEEIWRGHARACCARRCARAGATRPRRSRRSASRTSARRPCCGTARRGRPVHRAIVWQDRRTADRCERAHAPRALEAWSGARPGSSLDPYFSGDQAALAARARAAGARRARRAASSRFGTIDSWLVWKLTGGAVHATDPTNASRTLLYDIHARRWDDELLRAASSVPARGAAGGARVERRVRRRPTPDVLGAAVPIAGIAGDQQAALFGQGCVAPGMAKNTYGTGCFLLLHTGRRGRSPRRTGSLTTVACDARGGPAYALEGAVFVAGAAIQWLRDGLGLLEARARESEALARSGRRHRSASTSCRRSSASARRTGTRTARGAIVGLTRGATARPSRARDARVARLPDPRRGGRDGRATRGAPLATLRVDGGAAANDFLMQFQADMLGVPVERPDGGRDHRPRRGAARRARRSGFWSLRASWQPRAARIAASGRA